MRGGPGTRKDRPDPKRSVIALSSHGASLLTAANMHFMLNLTCPNCGAFVLFLHRSTGTAMS